jgi:UDP-N-acetylmuramate--alanine ligase
LLLIPHASAHLFPANEHTRTFGINEGDHKAINIRLSEKGFLFDYHNHNGKIENLMFALPGRHNILNAVVAITIALRLGVSHGDIRTHLQTFKGIQRRFDIKLKNDKFTVISDYAHHPTELNAVITAAKELYPGKKITGVFQPHLFSRTRDFMEDFALALSALDKVFLLPIYPAREEPIPGIHSGILLEKIHTKDKKLVEQYNLIAHFDLEPPEVLLLLGAGDSDQMMPQILEFFRAKSVNS